MKKFRKSSKFDEKFLFVKKEFFFYCKNICLIKICFEKKRVL